MKTVWLNKGRPNVRGVYAVVIVNSEGKEISRFEGASPEEVTKKVEECQVKAEGHL